MLQEANNRPERRRHPRQPQAFAFWIRPEHSDGRISAWMLDVSAEGAAFLTSAGKAPAVGERVELIEMLTRDRTVREAACPLPAYARVTRHDDSDGVVRRVAARFEADQPAPLHPIEDWGAAVPRQQSGSPPILPPPAAETGPALVDHAAGSKI